MTPLRSIIAALIVACAWGVTGTRSSTAVEPQTMRGNRRRYCGREGEGGMSSLRYKARARKR